MFDPVIEDNFRESANCSSFAGLSNDSSDGRQRSFAAFFGAIAALRTGTREASTGSVDRGFAQPHPRVRQLKPANDEQDCIRSGN